MAARGLATAQLQSYLHKLVKCVEALIVEMGKIEKKLGMTDGDKTTASPSSVDSGSSTGQHSVTTESRSNTGHPDSNTGHPEANTGRPEKVDTDPDSSASCPELNTGHPKLCDTHSTSNSDHPSLGADSNGELPSVLPHPPRQQHDIKQ